MLQIPSPKALSSAKSFFSLTLTIKETRPQPTQLKLKLFPADLLLVKTEIDVASTIIINFLSGYHRFESLLKLLFLQLSFNFYFIIEKIAITSFGSVFKNA